MGYQGKTGATGKIRKAQGERRRSARRELELEIRVFGTDFQGKDFVEDSSTLEINRHGAKIRLNSQLIPEQEIRILCKDNNREALFRVIRQVSRPEGGLSYWGVESLEAEEDIWEGARPRPKPIPPPAPAPTPAAEPGQPVKRGASQPLKRKPAQALDPVVSSKNKTPIQVMLRCSQCGMRELVDVEQTQIQTLRKMKGLVRRCPACGSTALWKPVAVQGA